MFVLKHDASMIEKARKEVKAVLLIDDDPDDFDLITEAIHEIDSSIQILLGQYTDIVDKAFISRFDLVLLDINMPLRDGFYWLNFLRQSGFHELPIIMYTNSLSPLHIAKAFTEGANLYFPKPDTYFDLKQGLIELIGMDWSEPMKVTQRYGRLGTFQTFPA